MAGQGTGPSRRSHTKSRKGCKTCKRRHIRCDETFPQCRNCTKHQVRCDYMETIGSDGDGQLGPEQTAILLDPATESAIDHWQQSGTFPYPALHVFPLPPTNEYSRNELRLMHHLCSISNDLIMRGTASLTIWTQKIPKFMSIASSYPYVMHALLSFSANHLAWTQSSQETKNLQIHYGTIALRGLHDAIGSFSHANADAVLAASLLLLWQASDWRSWSSLRAGIQSVIAAMQSWKHDSIFADYISEEDLLTDPQGEAISPFAADPNERYTIMTNTVNALQRLQATLVGNEVEVYWTGQLLQYVERLQASPPALTADDQLNHLYLLRKWLFWIPVQLLQGASRQGPAMLTMAHFFATALALEPLYPDLGSAFCARIALAPLETILSLTEAMQSQHPLDPNSVEIAALVQYPQQMAINFRSRMLEPYQGLDLEGAQPTFLGLSPEILSYANMGNISPAFAPSIPYAPTLPSTPSSTYLEVPTSKSGFTYGTQSWGAVPSPGFPPPAFTVEEEQYYSTSFDHFRGGFVPTPIWT